VTARTSPARRRTSALLAAGLLPLALAATACGAGLHAPTYQVRTTEDSTSASAGSLALRDVAILPPENGAAELAAGSDALATLTVGNPGNEADRLVQVTSPAAASVDLIDPSGHATPSVEIPAQGAVGPNDFSLALRSIGSSLRPGQAVEMTFVFERNGRTTFLVPVKMYDTPLPRASFSPPKSSEGE
jgi:copper(I)-binding protein